MYIKKILELEYNYAEYLISDGKNDLICMCGSVPLQNGKIPEVNMKVSKLNVFTYNEIKITKVLTASANTFITKGKSHFEYNLQAKIIDRDKSLLCIGELIISLETDYEDGLPKSFENGDIVAFTADRIDCELE